MRFPWDEVMALGLRELRLAPDAFWQMTLPELFAAAGLKHPPSMPRGILDQLMERFPDGEAE